MARKTDLIAIVDARAASEAPAQSGRMSVKTSTARATEIARAVREYLLAMLMGW
jgi:hypothetical protein